MQGRHSLAPSRREPMSWGEVLDLAVRRQVPALRFRAGELVDEYWPNGKREWWQDA